MHIRNFWIYQCPNAFLKPIFKWLAQNSFSRYWEHSLQLRRMPRKNLSCMRFVLLSAAWDRVLRTIKWGFAAAHWAQLSTVKYFATLDIIMGSRLKAQNFWQFSQSKEKLRKPYKRKLWNASVKTLQSHSLAILYRKSQIRERYF